jgi:hypothetical protein
MRRINRAARAHGRSVGQSDAHARTGPDDGREGRALWLPVPATPHPHRTSKKEHDKRPPPRPAARPPALAGPPRHIFHRQTANSGPTPLGAPRTTGEPPRRGRAVPGHGQAGDRRNLAALAVSLAPNPACLPLHAPSGPLAPHYQCNCLLLCYPHHYLHYTISC